MASPNEPHGDETNTFVPRSSDPSNVPEPEATVGDTMLTPNPGATIDSVRESFDAATIVSPEPVVGGLDATVVTGGDVSKSIVSGWGASLEADVEPGYTIKAQPSAAARSGPTFQPTIALKRRNVSQQEPGDNTPDATVNVDADYQIEELLGEGGMGAVYAARQKSMDRPVAIKVLKSQLAEAEGSQDAFVSEAIITGRLDHPNIVPIYDVGKQQNDALFYAMKQVVGVEWKERFATNTVSDNLDILLRVADAIAFAHARGIIHRDLKPANIMLGPFGEVLVMDWGLAMPTEDHPSRETFPDARAGGTPHYMAPEMASDTGHVDRRSDVYLLGAILFEIVTGKPPHALDIPGRNRRERVLAVLDAVANNVIAPTDASGELLDIARKAIATDPADRYQTVSEFQAALRKYLAHEESIELAARAAERLLDARQSGSYDEFSRARFGFETALEQWQENERTSAGLKETRFDYAKTAFDRGDLDLALSLIDESDAKQKQLGASILQAIVERDARQQQIRRLRRISLAASLVVAVVSVGASIWINSERSKALVAQQEEAAQRELAQRNEQEAQQQRQLAEAERAKAVAAQQEEAAQRAKATAAEADAKRETVNALRNLEVAERNAYYSDMALLRQVWNEGNANQFGSILERYRDRDDLRGFEWSYWSRVGDSALLDKESTGAFNTVSFSPNGELLAMASDRGGVTIRDAATGQESLKLAGNIGVVKSVAFSPDGMWLASAGNNRKVILWDVTTGQQKLELTGHAKTVTSLAFSPDGTQLASAGNDSVAKIWDVISGQERFELKGSRQPAISVAFSPDGTRIALGHINLIVTVWDAATGQNLLQLKGHRFPVKDVAYSPDGTRLATASSDRTVRLWDAVTGQEISTLQGHKGHVNSIAFSSDGNWLATAGMDQIVIVWDVATGMQTRVMTGHRSPVFDVSFSPDGTRLASVSGRGTLKIWDMIGGSLTLDQKQHSIKRVAFSPDGTRLATTSPDGIGQIWDVAAGQLILTLNGGKRIVKATRSAALAYSPDGTRLAYTSGSTQLTNAGNSPGTVVVCDAATGEETLTVTGHQGEIVEVAFSSDGACFATASKDKTLKVWDAATGRELLTLIGHTGAVRWVSFSPDGRLLGSAGDDGHVKVWDPATGHEPFTLNEPKIGDGTYSVHSLAFSSDGSRLVAAGKDGEITIWDLTSRQRTLSIKTFSDQLRNVSFSPDGKRLVGAIGNVVKAWNAVTGQEALAFSEHDDRVFDVSFSPDGTLLVTACPTGTVKILDARPSTPELKTQAQSRGYLTIMRDRMTSLEELQTYIRDDKTISEEVRQQCLDWTELFWKNRYSEQD